MVLNKMVFVGIGVTDLVAIVEMDSCTKAWAVPFKPSWYQGQANKIVVSSSAYYGPLFRAGSVTPLWHGMLVVGTVMYMVTQIGHRQKSVQAKRVIQKKALEEYYEKHGNPDAHH